MKGLTGYINQIAKSFVYKNVEPIVLKQIQKKDLYIKQLEEGVQKLQNRNDEWEREVRELRRENEPLHIILPVEKSDLLDAVVPKSNKKDKKETVQSVSRSPKIISWVIPPMGPISGGHITIFRTISSLEKRGYICRVYVYDPLQTTTQEEINHNLTNFTPINAEVLYGQAEIEPCDALFATNWHTAYPVYNSNATPNKFYYIQDFEPMFDPSGSYSTFAENTYKFGFHGITLGAWMKSKLEKEYDMTVDNFDLRVNKEEYHLKNKGERKKICFYARPVTPRRGFEIGILALEVFHKEHPEYEINLVGWDVSRFDDIGFEYVNHGIMDDMSKLNDLYNECVVGLVLSFTNMSLLPIEMMAAGCIPVVNDAEHTRSVGYSNYIEYALPTPTQLADGIYNAVVKASDISYVEHMSEYVTQFTWGDFEEDLDAIIRRKINS